MSPRRTFLFFTLLMVVILAQVLLLGWQPEALVFVTWLFLALTVRHDSRLSAAIGFVFLATCPFLLIAKKEPAAEQAANYAYFFLAIGVLVQLEEMVLERFRWLDRKVDLSHLWRPVAAALRHSWSAAGGALGRWWGAAGWAEWLQRLQIAGAVGLGAASLTAAFYGAWPPVVLALLGGAILFPLFMWGIDWVLRPVKPVWLLRAILVLVVVSLASAGMVWLVGLVTTDRLARMEEAYDFSLHLAEAEVASPGPDYVHDARWTIDGDERRVLFMHPDSRTRYTVQVPQGAVLTFDVATAPESWLFPGDGVAFAVYVSSGDGAQQVFSTYIDPKQNEADRHWHPFTVDLGDYAGQTVTLILETTSGPAGDNRYDWAGWGTPRLLAP